MATKQIAALVVDLVAESASYVAELKKAEKSTTDWGETVKKTTVRATKAMAAAAAAAATALAAMYTVTASAIDEQAKFADKIGITTESLYSLQHAGELTGVSTNTLNMGLQRMTRRVAEAAQGTGAAADALKELGLNAQALNQLSPDEQFKAIATAMEGVEDRADKLRIAFKLFDSEGTALLNTLDLGAAGLEDIAEEAERYGIALSRVDAVKVENANDAFYRTGLMTKGLTRQLTTELSPIIEGVSNEFLNAASAAGGMGEVATTAVDYLVRGLDVVYASLLGLKNGWNVVKLATIEAARWGVEALRALEYDLKAFVNMIPGLELELSDTMGSALTTLRQASADARQDLLDTSQELNTQLVEIYNNEGKIKGITDQWRENAQATAEATVAAKDYGDTVSDVGDALTDVQEDVANTHDDAMAALESQIARLAASIDANTGMMERASTSWANSFSSELANMVTKGEMDFARLAESIINDLIRIAIQANITRPLMESIWGGVGGGGGGTETPPAKASGGPVTRGSTYLVGEQGPELFRASNSGSIVPNNKLAGNTTTVNVYTQPGETAETTTRSSPQGDIIDIMMKQVDSRMNEQISRGQGLARTLEGRYALSRKAF